MNKEYVKHSLKNEESLNCDRLQEWKHDYLPKIKSEYKSTILKNLDKYTSLPTDIAKNVIVAYLIEDCDCCHTLICLRSRVKSVSVNFIYKIEASDHDGYCSGMEGEPIDPYTIEIRQKIFEEEFQILSILRSTGNIKYQKKYLANYDCKYDDCSSDGSKFCKGCYIDAKLIDIVKK